MVAKTFAAHFPTIGYEVVQICDNFRDAKSALATLRPTLATLDLRIRFAPGEPPQNLTTGDIRALCSASPTTRICALTESESPHSVEAALAGGLAGYLTKGTSLDETRVCFQTLMSGRPYYQASLATSVIPEVFARRSQYQLGSRSPFDALTDQQRRVCADLLDGLEPSEIARRRNLSESTVARYRSRIRAMVGVENDVQLLRAAQRHGFIPY